MGRRGPAPMFTSELRVNVRPEQRAAIATLAEASDVSISAVVRAALDGFLHQDERPEGRAWDKEPTR